MIVAFTGPRAGMTGDQAAAVARFLMQRRPRLARHGDCVGADEQFAALCSLASIPQDIYPGHPPGRPEDDRWRAYTDRMYGGVIVVRRPAPFMERNTQVVTGADFIIGTPNQARPVPRSGTWATLRIALRLGVPGSIILPDGDAAPLATANA